jgi:hypothetical protein
MATSRCNKVNNASKQTAVLTMIFSATGDSARDCCARETRANVQNCVRSDLLILLLPLMHANACADTKVERERRTIGRREEKRNWTSRWMT